MCGGWRPAGNHNKSATKEWFLTWLHCFQTLLMYSTMARGVVGLQLRTFVLLYVSLPIVLWWSWVRAWFSWRLGSGFFRNKQSSTSSAPQQHSSHVSLEHILAQQSMITTCIDLARFHSIDGLFLRLVQQQALREVGGGQGKELFLSIDTPTSAVSSSLTAAQTVQFVESVAVVMGVELYANGLYHQVPERGDSVQQHTVALLLTNSVYYSPLYMGVSRASSVLSVLHASTTTATTQRKADGTPSSGHSCNAALLNTSIANNAMLSRSMASSGSELLVVDASLLWLLFPDASSDLTVSVSSGIKKILLWYVEPVVIHGHRSSSLRGELPVGVTVAHLLAIARYNDEVCTAPQRKHLMYANDGEELTALWLSNLVVFGIAPTACTLRAATTTPTHGMTGGNSSHTPHSVQPNNSNIPSSPRTVAARPDRSPPTLVPSSFPTSYSGATHLSNASSAYVTDLESSTTSNKDTLSTTNRPRNNTPPLLSLAAYNNAAAHRRLVYMFCDVLLEHLGVTLCPMHYAVLCKGGVEGNRPQWRRWRAMSRTIRASYNATDPILKIYTSGTTGLPKAAKFTHLRFHMAMQLTKQTDVLGRTERFLSNAVSDNELHPSSAGCSSSSRVVQTAAAFPTTFREATQVLTVYNTLPMYHSAGGVFCTAHLMTALQTQLRRGCLDDGTPPTARMVLRKKFSASHLAHDLQAHRVHIIQYIGEVLRYAIAAVPKSQPHPTAPANNKKGSDADASVSCHWMVPVAFGNGLRRDVWMDVLQRLPIASVVEFYASTEGNVGFINMYDEPFAVGHAPVFPTPFRSLSPLFWGLFPMKLVRYDPETCEPYRDFQFGRCRVVDIGEVGELVGKVPSRSNGFDPIGLRRFDGYHDANETKKKLLYGVLKDGDTYFRSGDLMTIDARGYVTFVDRIGDTFRWKGENVSTLEVANALNAVRVVVASAAAAAGASKKDVGDDVVSVYDAVVYGVAVAGYEGKAGMARLSLVRSSSSGGGSDALVVASKAEEASFLRHHLYRALSDKAAASSLPAYAVPLFIRVGAPTDLDPASQKLTGTFKHRPVALASEGYNAAVPSTNNSSSALSSPTSSNEAVHEDRYYVLVKAAPSSRVAADHHKPVQWMYVPMVGSLPVSSERGW